MTNDPIKADAPQNMGDAAFGRRSGVLRTEPISVVSALRAPAAIAKENSMVFQLEYPASEQVARAIWSAAHAAWELCLSGVTWPKKEQRYERMKNPVAGDLVIEVGGGLREARCDNAVGWIIRQTREPVWTPEEWAEAGGGDDPIPDERVFYIKTLTGQECRWVNAEFLAVPQDSGWWTYERQKHRDPLASAGEAGTAETVQHGSVHEHATAQPGRPNHTADTGGGTMTTPTPDTLEDLAARCESAAIAKERG